MLFKDNSKSNSNNFVSCKILDSGMLQYAHEENSNQRGKSDVIEKERADYILKNRKLQDEINEQKSAFN